MLLINSFYNSNINFSKYSKKCDPEPPFIHTTLIYYDNH